MNVFAKTVVVAFSWSLVGCTSISVQPMSGELNATSVCIEKNPRVIRSDFLPVLERGFQNHGISTVVFTTDKPDNCELVVTYTATQTWDMAMVLADAEIWIHKSGKQVAYGNYHLRGKGGFSLMKWQGSEKKILPLLDQLLIEYE